MILPIHRAPLGHVIPRQRHEPGDDGKEFAHFGRDELVAEGGLDAGMLDVEGAEFEGGVGDDEA